MQLGAEPPKELMLSAVKHRDDGPPDIQSWLRKENISRPWGRPRKLKFSHVMETGKQEARKVASEACEPDVQQLIDIQDNLIKLTSTRKIPLA